MSSEQDRTESGMNGENSTKILLVEEDTSAGGASGGNGLLCVKHVNGLNAKYHLHELLGRGGMGMVYRATDLNLRRIVALKVLFGRTEYREADTRQFIEEAQIASQLEHPNIVPVHDIGSDTTGNLFYTMKLVEGVTLADILNGLRRGEPELIEKYPLSKLLTIFQKVCDAVAFAHSKGVLHQDLKPGNVMIGEYGEVLVMDWGLARLLDRRYIETCTQISVAGDAVQAPAAVAVAEGTATVEAEPGPDMRVGSSMRTMDGTVMGTPAFMAPEQLNPGGGEPSTLSDIYALGAILYSLLTLRPSVTGPDLKTVLGLIRSGEIMPPVEFNEAQASSDGTDAVLERVPPEERGVRLLHLPDGKVPAMLSDVVMKAMALTPTDRFAAVKQLQEQVENYQNGIVWNVVLQENAFGAGVDGRWLVGGGHCESSDGELRLYGGEPQFLLLRQPLSGDVRIEYECRQESDYLTDMSCFIAAIRGDNLKEIPVSGYEFKFGGYSNTVNTLERAGQQLWSCPASPLQRGALYQVCAERVGSLLRMTVNGEEIFSVTDPDPLSGGERTAVGLSGSMTDSRYTKIRISCLGTPWKMDVLELADQYLQSGHYSTAMEIYQKVIDSAPDAARLAAAQTGLTASRNRNRLSMSLSEWNEKLKAAWPGMAPKLRMDNEGFSLDLSNSGIADLEPLRGMPLTMLNCSYNRIASLAPLAGMPLSMLNCNGNPVRDISPLCDMPLATLLCEGCPVESLEPLRSLPLKMLNCGGAHIGAQGLEPLRGKALSWLCCWGSGVEDLSPLAGMPLTALYCDGNRIASLEPLRGMPLGRLICSGNQIEDLTPLRGMPLTTLHCADNLLTSLEPLRGMKLNLLSCQSNRIVSLDALSGCPPAVLKCGMNRLSSIGPLIKAPPASFVFDCDTIPMEELQWMRQHWERDFRYAEHARNVEIIQALRRRDAEALRAFASEFEAHLYLYIPAFMKWETACRICEELGGHLVTITSGREAEFVNSLVKGGSWFWMGLETTPSGHRWVTGESYRYGVFVDPLRESLPGGKVFCNGLFTSEVYPGVSNCFMIEWR